MVLQQCLACNSLITEPCKSCVCGHVFEDAKQIGGKRFSEYRANLYSRLENKRMRQIARENRRPKDVQPQVPTECKTNLTESDLATPSTFELRPHSVSRPFHRRRKGKRFPRPITDPSPSKTVVPPELVSRLPSALQEINRRLTGQNVMWWTMQLQWENNDRDALKTFLPCSDDEQKKTAT